MRPLRSIVTPPGSPLSKSHRPSTTESPCDSLLLKVAWMSGTPENPACMAPASSGSPSIATFPSENADVLFNWYRQPSPSACGTAFSEARTRTGSTVNGSPIAFSAAAREIQSHGALLVCTLGIGAALVEADFFAASGALSPL